MFGKMHIYDSTFIITDGEWEGELGREPDVEMYLRHLEQMFPFLFPK